MVDRITRSAYFITVKSTYSAKDYARIYIEKVVSLHVVPFSFISVEVLNLHLGF